MFPSSPPTTQPAWKRPVYLACTILLGIILSYGVHAILEIAYLRWAENTGHVITWYTHFGLGSCALHPVVQYGLLATGIVWGWLTGRIWWRWVYVEGKHWHQRLARKV